MGSNRSGVRRTAKMKQTKKYRERLLKKAATAGTDQKSKAAAKA